MSKIIDPSFFIVGAPKCGTSALAEYLDSHPNLKISLQKEPHFYAKDMYSTVPLYSKKLEVYRELFRCEDSENVKQTGEASAWYYFSETAIPLILEAYENPRFIFMVRNPIDLVPSLHGQLVYNGPEYEFAENFQDSWNLQDRRLQGEQLPARFRDSQDRGSKILQYREAAKLGERLSYLKQIIPSEALKVIVFDDFVADTKKVYQEVLKFIDVPDDGKSDFPKVNPHAQRRFHLIHIFGHKVIQPLLKSNIGRSFKRRFGKPLTAIYQRIVSVPSKREKVPREMTEELIKCFSSDVEKLSELLDRDLSHWLQRPDVADD